MTFIFMAIGLVVVCWIRFLSLDGVISSVPLNNSAGATSKDCPTTGGMTLSLALFAGGILACWLASSN